MTNIGKTRQALLAAALLVTPAAALAQNDVTAQANQVAEEAQDLQQASNALATTVAQEQETADRDAARDDGRDRHDRDEDDGFPWGLLGLLGLAGLLGLKRRDDDHRRHVDVDRRDYDRTTTTGTSTGTRGTGADTDTRL